MQRLAFLDSYRAIAISAVAAFHYFALWAPPLTDVDIYPYGSQFTQIFFFKFGYFGVQLFFLISGFVIALTLEHCDSLHEFAVKRIARLWPALIVCTALAYLLAMNSPLPTVPAPKPIDLLPSLTTIGPRFFDFTGSRSEYLIGSVWSLFVEIRFYLIAGLIYFFISRKWLVSILLTMSLLAMTLVIAHGKLTGPLGAIMTTIFLVKHIGWLALGGYCYRLHAGTQTVFETCLALLNWIALVCLNWLFAEHDALSCALIAGVVTAIFVISTVSAFVQRILSQRFLLQIGAVSYSLYLVHELVGVRLIHQINPGLPVALQLTLVGLIYGAMIVLSLGLYAWVEIPGRDILRHLFLRRATPIAVTNA